MAKIFVKVKNFDIIHNSVLKILQNIKNGRE